MIKYSVWGTSVSPTRFLCPLPVYFGAMPLTSQEIMLNSHQIERQRGALAIYGKAENIPS